MAEYYPTNKRADKTHSLSKWQCSPSITDNRENGVYLIQRFFIVRFLFFGGFEVLLQFCYSCLKSRACFGKINLHLLSFCYLGVFQNTHRFLPLSTCLCNQGFNRFFPVLFFCLLLFSPVFPITKARGVDCFY